MCRYIGDAQRTTPTKSALELTGGVATDVSKNIYDLAGNCLEWTMEASSTTSRVYRGSSYSFAIPVSIRGYFNLAYSSEDYSFRPILYIK